MANKVKRTKMPISERAKQFAPFSALTGLYQALSAAERVVVPKRELTEDCINRLNQTLNLVQPGDMVTVIYFDKGEYLKTTGKVSRINLQEHILQVVQKKIRFEDLYDLVIEEQ